MASDVMSLFGMDPNVIQQNRVQSGVDNAARMNANYAIGAAGGQMLGAGINSAFGLQTPEMAQASSVQSGLEGQNLNTASGLRAAAQQLMMNGDYAQAMALHAQARDMEASELTASNAAEDRKFGKVKSIKVKIGEDDFGVPILADKMVRYTLDGKVLDMLTGEDLSSKVVNDDDADTPKAPNAAEVLEALRAGKTLPNGAKVSATDMINGVKPQEVVDNEILDAELKADDVAQTAHEENITLYDSMLPSIKTGPAGLELKAKIDAFEETLVSPISDAEFEAQKVNRKKAEKYQKDLGVLQNNIDAIQASYSNMPEISKGSQQGMLLSTMLLDAIQEKDLFIQSNPQG